MTERGNHMVRITSLLENTTQCADMQIEHGLSLYIETSGHRILFDMGQTTLFAENAAKLGIDLSRVDLAVLSHGHYDHGGGLRKFLTLNKTAPVYIHRDAFLPHYNGTEKYIGLDTMLSAHRRIRFTDETFGIDETLRLDSCNQRPKKHPLWKSGLFEKTGTGFVEDDFRHEQYLSIRDSGKTILISGCSHKGILNIANWFRPDVLVGGFHFSKLPPDQTLENAAKELASYPTDYYTCHCTGVEQYNFLSRFLPRLHYLSCGQTVVIE